MVSERPRYNRVQISRDLERSLEDCSFLVRERNPIIREKFQSVIHTFRKALLSTRVLNLCLIRYDCPLSVCHGTEFPGRLQIGLIEARENLVGASRLELSVKILSVVFLIDERVETFSILFVLVQEKHLHRVHLPLLQHGRGQGNMLACEVFLSIRESVLSVYEVIANFHSPEV